MRYLTVEEVLALHDEEVPDSPLVRPDLLDSAVMAPRQSAFGEDAYPTIHLKAAALLRGIASNHVFLEHLAALKSLRPDVAIDDAFASHFGAARNDHKLAPSPKTRAESMFSSSGNRTISLRATNHPAG